MKSRFVGAYNYCDGGSGRCVCDQHLLGAYCNIPAASVIAVSAQSGASGNETVHSFYNIPLYPGSLRLYIPPHTTRL